MTDNQLIIETINNNKEDLLLFCKLKCITIIPQGPEIKVF